MSDDLTVEQTMRGLLALVAADRKERLTSREREVEPRKTELFLADAGLIAGQMGRLLNKKPNSVAKTIARAREKE